MIDLRSHLQDGDPVAREGDLALADGVQLRRNILSAVPSDSPAVGWRFLPVGTVLVLICVGSAWFVRVSAPEPVLVRAELPRRQLQFSTPNGTRIIWTFNPDLEVR